ncbi:MAG: hypothetical protein J6Q98_04730 [Bacteroidaceae bacterium]|nr:hypothetical protein [Bacteroidaceae bacterium]
MKRISRILLLSGGILSAMVPATAQRWVEMPDGATPIICISETVNEAPDVIEIFQNTQSSYHHDARAPRFVLVDQQGKWGLGIGGYLQTKIEYDFDKAVDNVDFLPSAIQRDGAPSSQYRMDMSNSALFMKLVGRSRLLGDFVVYTSGNWRGGGLNFQLQNAYMSTKYMKLGYTVGSFMDIAAIPVTIDYGGPCGMTFYRSTQAMFKYGFDFGLSMGVALEVPDVIATENENISLGAQRMPAIPIFVQYNLGGWSGNHIRLGAVMRDISYSDKLSGKDYDKVGWGAQASLLATLGKLQLKGQFTVGEGIGSLVNNISNVGVDVVPDPEKPGKAMMLQSEAWYAGLQYNFTDKLFASAVYSQTVLHSRGGYATVNPGAYRKGQYLAANIFYNITDNMQLGVEYLHGWRMDFDDKTFNANRVNLSARYDF